MENIFKELLSLDSIIKLLGIIISLFGIVIPLYKFLAEKNLKQRDLRFKTYHLLIKDLVEPDKETGKIMLDRQIATCFELRNFPEYFELTKRILTDLKEQWGGNEKNKRIILEINYTIKYIKLYNNIFFTILRFIGLKKICKFIINAIL